MVWPCSIVYFSELILRVACGVGTWGWVKIQAGTLIFLAPEAQVRSPIPSDSSPDRNRPGTSQSPPGEQDDVENVNALTTSEGQPVPTSDIPSFEVYKDGLGNVT
jgi:hypothetical protein